jgi:hypothetical protein
MTDGRRKHVAVALEKIAVARETAERARNVGSDGRFLGNDQRFRYEGLEPISKNAILETGSAAKSGR